jgi:hypothetical protein
LAGNGDRSAAVVLNRLVLAEPPFLWNGVVSFAVAGWLAVRRGR